GCVGWAWPMTLSRRGPGPRAVSPAIRPLTAMPSAAEVLITGTGVLSPIGLTLDAYWRSLEERRSGVGPLSAFEANGLPVRIAAEARDFEPKALVRPRKSLKVMVRDAQLAVAAADLAFADAGLEP